MLNDMPSSHDSIPLKTDDEPVYLQVPSLPPIAGFWRRFFAWFIDVVLLGLAGLLLVAVFSSVFFKIGPYGRPIGLLFVIPYFGILNSKIGGGQTIGKRFLKIAVRNKNNEPIGLGRAITRISILYLPVLLNGWSLPIFQNPVLKWLASLIVFGLGGAILYTMLFNRKARQGVHDYLTGTYVIHLPGKPVAFFPATSRIHWIMASAWVGIIVIGMVVVSIISPSIITKAPLQSAMNLYDVMNNDPRFFSVGIQDHTLYGLNSQTSRTLIINVWYKGKPGEEEKKEIVESIAKTVFEYEKNLEAYDALQIKISSGFDIGIASGNVHQGYIDSIDNWRKGIDLDGTSGNLTTPS